MRNGKKTTKPARKIQNWLEYNEALVNRGDITFWFREEALQKWNHKNVGHRRGRPFIYSDSAIETLLLVREYFHLTYWSTEGLGRGMFAMLNVQESGVPDYTSLCKRAKTINIAAKIHKRTGHIDVLVDSTGLKVFGEGDWKMRTHGKSKRRTWRKIHLALDEKMQKIYAVDLTPNSVHDADAVKGLLNQIPDQIGKFYGDGGYDKWKVYGSLADRDIVPIIPPQHNAKITQHGNSRKPRLARDEAIRAIHRKGRSAWKREVGYHRRSLVETAMFRLKTIFGDRLKNRLPETQKTEAQLKCKILNYFTQLGLPKY